VIHSEEPFFRLCATDFTFPPEATLDPRWQIWQNLQLYRPIHTGHGADYDRFRATSLRCGTYHNSNHYGEASGVFLQAARFNSSCRPNVHAHWIQSKERMDFIALRDIAPEEELCICYDPPTLLYSTAERKERLLTAFGFSCNCTACVQGSPDSDRRRTNLRATVEGRVSNPSNDVQVVSINLVSETTRLMTKRHCITLTRLPARSGTFMTNSSTTTPTRSITTCTRAWLKSKPERTTTPCFAFSQRVIWHARW
jgi:hypothetical protein